MAVSRITPIPTHHSLHDDDDDDGEEEEEEEEANRSKDRDPPLPSSLLLAFLAARYAQFSVMGPTNQKKVVVAPPTNQPLFPSR